MPGSHGAGERTVNARGIYTDGFLPFGAGGYTKNLTAGRKRRGGREGDNMAGRMQTFDLMRELFYNEW